MGSLAMMAGLRFEAKGGESGVVFLAGGNKKDD
jgi:hypothetical protein